MNILGFIGYLFGATFSIFLAIIKIFFIAAIGAVAGFKGYHAWIWMLATLLLPWPCPILILPVILYLPRKLPKLPGNIRRNPAFEGKNPVIASIMALSAMIAKADGNVTREEIRLVKDFLTTRFNISREELNDYADAFDYGKNHADQYLIFVNIITGYYRTRLDVIKMLCFLFTGVALQEGESTAAKEEQNRKIVLALGMSEYEYQVLRQMILSQMNGTYQEFEGYQNAGGYGQAAYQNQEDLVKKYTEVLGLTPDASMSDIKKAYRKLVKEYHPDKLSSENVPPEYIEFANKKIRDINEAYEYLEKVKGGK